MYKKLRSIKKLYGEGPSAESGILSAIEVITVLKIDTLWIVQYSQFHHHRVQEGLDLIPVPCILKMKLVPPSLPRSSYVSSFFWFIL